MANNTFKMTESGYQNLEEKLQYLKNDRRKEIKAKLQEARSQGDLSENAEYDSAKEEQAILEQEINEIEYRLANAEIISYDETQSDKIALGSTVRLKDLELEEEFTVKIVSSTEADADRDLISEETPVAQAAMGRKKGDIIEVNAPLGMIKMEILNIE
ncbi:MAG: transcription elongation factor GreA [Oscillospiraceae bacterium]|nr:transcription elongation factor GreA [Oscillospiraceae bacterium]